MKKIDVLLEFVKCKENPKYAITKYLKTFDKTKGGMVKFKLFPKQEEIIDSFENETFTITAKPRQAGVSTTTTAYAAIKLALGNSDNPEKVLILANKQDLAQEMLKKVREFLVQLPSWMGVELVNDSKKSIVLSNGCEVRALATSPDALRGYTPTFLIFDEAAYIERGDEVYGSALASISTGGKMVLISTFNGYDPLFYKTYDTAKQGKNEFNIVEMRWYQDPRYNIGLKWQKINPDTKQVEETIEETDFDDFDAFQEKISQGLKPTSPWYERMCAQMNGDKRKIAQELDCSPIGSGGNVIEADIIERIEKTEVITPLGTAGYDNNIWVWEEPLLNESYILSCDVARGDGEDSSTFVIIKSSDNTVAVEYQGMTPPDTLGEMVYEWGNKYNAYVIVDIAGGMGVATVLKLMDMGYKNLHYDTQRGNPIEKKMSAYSNDKKKMPGFNATSSRTNIVSEFERCLRQEEIRIPSQRLVMELRTFVYVNGRADHMKGYHDDLIMAYAMALWVKNTSFKNLQNVTEKAKLFLSAWKTNATSETLKRELSNMDIKSLDNKEKIKEFKKKVKDKDLYRRMGVKNHQHLWLFGL